MQNNCRENSKEIQKHQCDLCLFVTPIWIWTWQTFSGITHPKHVPSMLTVRVSIITFLLFSYLQLQIKTTPMLCHLQTVRKAAGSHTSICWLLFTKVKTHFVCSKFAISWGLKNCQLFLKTLFCFVAQLIAASLIRTNTGSETGTKQHFKSDCNPQATQYLTPAGLFFPTTLARL